MRIVKVTFVEEMPKEQHEKLKNQFSWLYLNHLDLPVSIKAKLIRMMNSERKGD